MTWYTCIFCIHVFDIDQLNMFNYIHSKLHNFRGMIFLLKINRTANFLKNLFCLITNFSVYLVRTERRTTSRDWGTNCRIIIPE